MPTSPALKATVTRRQAADPVDQADQAAVKASQTAVAAAITEAATVTAEPVKDRDTEKPKREANKLQTAFLAGNLDKSVTVFTINGVKLTGKLRQFDQFTLLLQSPDGLSSLVFKHAVTTVVPVSTAQGEQRHPQQGGAYP